MLYHAGDQVDKILHRKDLSNIKTQITLLKSQNKGNFIDLYSRNLLRIDLFQIKANRSIYRYLNSRPQLL